MIPTSSHGQSGCPKQNRYYHHAPPSPSSKLRSTICRSLPLKTHGFQSFFPRPFFADGSKPGAHLADRVRDWCSGQHAPTACTGATSQGGLWHSNSCHPDAWNKRRIHLYVYIYIILLYICIWVCDIYYTSSNLWCTKVICIEYIYIYTNNSLIGCQFGLPQYVWQTNTYTFRIWPIALPANWEHNFILQLSKIKVKTVRN